MKFSPTTPAAPLQTVSEAPAVEPVKSYGEELLDFIGRQSQNVPFAVFGVLLVIAGLVYSQAPLWTLAWLVLVSLVLLLRWLILPRIPSLDLALDARIRIAAALSGINGLAHASSLAFFPLLTDLERAVQSLILAGLCTGALGTTAGDRRIFLPYFVTIFVPLIALWATNGTWSTPTREGVGLAMSVTIFGLVLLMLSRDANRQFTETIRIRKAQEETNIQLQQALQDAGVADRAKTRFLASASHDLRQPIHALSLFGAALRRQPLPESAAQLADNIDESISVLASQLDALLDISKLDAGVIAPDPELIDLTAMLRRIGREYEVDVTDRGLDFRLTIDEGCRVRTDKLLLERVVRNLLNNSVRYTKQGEVSLECRITDRECVVAVADTGIGIPESEQRNIFSEFYQVGERHGASKQGLGLGLSIVTRLLALLDIPLDLKSAPGEGTRIELSLPVEAETISQSLPAGEGQLAGLTVLVIDDDRSVRSAMTAILASLDSRCVAVATIDEALAAFEEQAPDVVLSDLQLRGESGLEAIARLRERRPTLPAVLITGDTGAEQMREAHETGLDVLHKPVQAIDLERKIAEVVRR